MRLPPDSRAALDQACRDAGIDAADDLERLALPAVELVTTPAGDDDIKVGATKMGGAADLPEGTSWPMVEDCPLAFMAQIDLAGAQSVTTLDWLPREGCTNRRHGPLTEPESISSALDGLAAGCLHGIASILQ